MWRLCRWVVQHMRRALTRRSFRTANFYPNADSLESRCCFVWGDSSYGYLPNFVPTIIIYHVSGALYIVPCSQGLRSDGAQRSPLRGQRERHRYYGALADLALDVYAALVLADNSMASI